MSTPAYEIRLALVPGGWRSSSLRRHYCHRPGQPADIHAIHGANPCHSLNARRGSRVGVDEVEGIGTAEAASPDAALVIVSGRRD